MNERIDVKFKLQIFVLGLLTTLSISCQPAYCCVTTRENEVVNAVRKVSPAVIKLSSQYEIRKNSNPFSVNGVDPMLEKFFNDFNKRSVILLIQREGYLYHINTKMKE